MSYPIFDRSRLRLRPLAERDHDLTPAIMMDPEATPAYTHPTITLLAERIRAAREKGATVLMMLGGHVIRAGAAPCLIRLMQEGYITHFAMNGAASIHDFEMAMAGGTSESVARYISEGQFGLWQDDERYNEALALGRAQGLGFGESLGKYMEDNQFPYRATSLVAAGVRHRVPTTVHVGIGNDIVHELPNADGAVTGAASYEDFLIYTHAIESLEGGVFLNFGSAVTGPEVYLKALSMARNVAHQEGRKIAHFTTAVFDLLPLEGEDVRETPEKTDPRYYFRPWKTIMSRTVADGGESYYVQGDHKHTVAALNAALR